MESLNNALTSLASILISFASTLVSLLANNPLIFAIALLGVIFKGVSKVKIGNLFEARTGK